MTKKKEQLIAIVGEEHVCTDPEILDAYRGDRSFVLPIKPAFVVRPKNADEVHRLVVWANQTTSQLIPVSSGPPHFYGDTAPGAPGCVIVELGRMDRILRIDRRNKMAVIEPGVTYHQLAPELAREGLRVTTPLLPRKNKSVIASLLERQPTLIPRYHYAMTEPLRNCGVVWGNGDITYTGEAGNSSYNLEEQWNAGLRQVDPKGPAQTDFLRLLTGAQGSMGIVTWASIKCELAPQVRKLCFVTAKKLQSLIPFVYRLQRLRLGDELMVVNNAQLALILGQDPEQVQGLKRVLPSWAVIIGVAGRALFPEEKVEVQEKDMADLAQHFGLQLQSSIPGTTNQTVQNAILGLSGDPFWKLAYKGGCQDIFFLTTLAQTPEYAQIVFSAASALQFPASDVGVYIQPQHQGVAQHCEFNLPFDPQQDADVTRIRNLYTTASEQLIAHGAYFARPYGAWADMVYNRDARSTNALRKIKRIFDPNNVMNPGRLCFYGLSTMSKQQERQPR